MTERKLLLRVLALLGLIVLLIYPFETTVVPEWKIRIVDEAGDPLRVTRVREVWQHYTIESASHEEDLITDGDGYVTFPRPTVRGSLLVRIGVPIVNGLNVHASFGSAPGCLFWVTHPTYFWKTITSIFPANRYPRGLCSRERRTDAV